MAFMANYDEEENTVKPRIRMMKQETQTELYSACFSCANVGLKERQYYLTSKLINKDAK